MAWKRRGAPCEFLEVYTTVDLWTDHSQEIDLRGREVSRGDGNLVSIEYECLLYFYLNHRVLIRLLGSIFSIVGMQRLGKFQVSMKILGVSC